MELLHTLGREWIKRQNLPGNKMAQTLSMCVCILLIKTCFLKVLYTTQGLCIYFLFLKLKKVVIFFLNPDPLGTKL